MSKEIGFVLWEGASLIDGAPIAVIATMASNNRKTGKPGKKNMIQTWIIRTDIEPHKAAKQGLDYSVCGDCVHRPEKSNSCYVTLFQAPLAVFRGYHRGIYSHDLEAFERELPTRKLRIGAYGDAGATPTAMWTRWAGLAMGRTGYTHQWQRPDFDPALLDLVMASVDTPEQALKVKSRYFRVKGENEPALKGEVECLADSKNMNCADCLVCDGGNKGKSIYINVHGAKASNFNPNIIAIAA